MVAWQLQPTRAYKCGIRWYVLLLSRERKTCKEKKESTLTSPGRVVTAKGAFTKVGKNSVAQIPLNR